MERTKMPNLRNGSKGGFEPGLTRLRVRHSTTELPRSINMPDAITHRQGVINDHLQAINMLHYHFTSSRQVLRYVTITTRARETIKMKRRTFACRYVYILSRIIWTLPPSLPPPSLPPSLPYCLPLIDAAWRKAERWIDPFNLMGLRRQADRQHYVISRHLWHHRTSSGSF